MSRPANSETFLARLRFLNLAFQYNYKSSKVDCLLYLRLLLWQNLLFSIDRWYGRSEKDSVCLWWLYFTVSDRFLWKPFGDLINKSIVSLLSDSVCLWLNQQNGEHEGSAAHFAIISICYKFLSDVGKQQAKLRASVLSNFQETVICNWHILCF